MDGQTLTKKFQDDFRIIDEMKNNAKAYVFADMGVDYKGIVLHYFPGCEIKSEIIEKSNEQSKNN